MKNSEEKLEMLENEIKHLAYEYGINSVLPFNKLEEESLQVIDSYIESLDDEEVNKEDSFFNTRIPAWIEEIEKEKIKKEKKRSDVIEFE